MTDCNCDSPGGCDSNSDDSEEKPRRPRKATLLNLAWLRERVQKTERIKESLGSGAYEVDSDRLAKALLNDD
jgi:anti-sigma28 factor (negative regulator of flagellin synthesis)